MMTGLGPKGEIWWEVSKISSGASEWSGGCIIYGLVCKRKHGMAVMEISRSRTRAKGEKSGNSERAHESQKKGQVRDIGHSDSGVLSPMGNSDLPKT